MLELTRSLSQCCSQSVSTVNAYANVTHNTQNKQLTLRGLPEFSVTTK